MSDDGQSPVLYEKAEGIAWITINRPEVRNALNQQVFDGLMEAFHDAAGDGAVGVVVLTGAGDKAFCAGGDVRAMAAPPGDRPPMRRLPFYDLMDLLMLIRATPKPVIAMVNGDAIGGGNELHLACDLSVAADHARFGQVGPRVGMCPVVGGTQYLPLLIGERRAKEVVFLCHRYSAEEAWRMGWVNRVVAASELRAATDEWCQELLDKSPRSLRVAKASLNYFGDLSYPSFAHGQLMLRDVIAGTDEQREGAVAFLERRPPDYRQFRH